MTDPIVRRGSMELSAAQKRGFRSSIEAPWFAGAYASEGALQAARPAASHQYAMAIVGTVFYVSDGATWVAGSAGGSVAWSAISDKPTFANVATSGAYADLSGRPTLAAVATSGAYADLSGRPTLGTAASLNVAASGDAAAGEVVKGNDSRLAYTPPTNEEWQFGVEGTIKLWSPATLVSTIRWHSVQHWGNAANQAAMVALNQATQWDTVRRTDTGTDWRLTGADPAVAGNWTNLGSAGSITSGSISDFTEATQDVVGAMIAAAGGSYNDAAGSVSLPNAGAGASIIPAWSANTSVTTGQVVRATMMGAVVYLRSLTTRTTSATFSGSEAANWGLVSQIGDGTWASEVPVVEGFRVVYLEVAYLRSAGWSGSTGIGAFDIAAWTEVPALGNVSTLTVASSRNIASTDDRKILRCSPGITLTLPSGLNPRPRFGVEFDSGTITIAVSGGATVNGATTSLTRSITYNPAGFSVIPRAGSDGYGVSGA